MEIQQVSFNPTVKQAFAYLRLIDDTTREIGYGGSAGSGKSFLGCFWAISQCLNYSGVCYAIGRKELTTLKKTTLVSFFEVCALFGMEVGKHFSFNQQTNIIEFNNSSKIFLIDTAYQPSDPLYQRFGGLLLTGAFVDESGETPLEAIKILKTRIGRMKNGEYNIIPKLLETFNPSKEHIYSRYYLPWKEKRETKEKIFIQALPGDNPHLPRSYIEQLEQADEITRERLLKGNFEYDSDERALCPYNKLTDLFSNSFVESGEKFMSVDLAMKGRDRCVIIIWEGLRAKIEKIMTKSGGKDIEEEIKRISELYSIPRSNIIYDSDGMGAYLESYLEGANEYHGGAKANDDEYKNLKSECMYKLAELINKNLIYIDETRPEIKSLILEELGQLKRDDLDKDEQKKAIIKKEEMKQNLNRSPDFLDALMMRMYFEVKNNVIISF